MAANHEILALFDLDGTLLRAGDTVHHDAFEHGIRATFGVSVRVRDLELAGAVDRHLFHAAVESAGITATDAAAGFEQWVAVVDRYYRLRVGAGDRVDWILPGVTELLRKLRATGVALAIATGSARGVGEAKLAASGLADYFPVGAFGDEVHDRAALLRSAIRSASAHYGRRFLAANAVVLGDTPVDIRAAREIGARVVAVATGRFGVDELDQHGPDATFVDFAIADAVVKVIRDVALLPPGTTSTT